MRNREIERMRMGFENKEWKEMEGIIIKNGVKSICSDLVSKANHSLTPRSNSKLD
jgi:hypothetical protein